MNRPNLKELFIEHKDMIVSNATGTVFVLLLVIVFFTVRGYVNDHYIRCGAEKRINNNETSRTVFSWNKRAVEEEVR